MAKQKHLNNAFALAHHASESDKYPAATRNIFRAIAHQVWLSQGARHIRARDLKDQIGQPGARPVLYCAVCKQTCSANKGDYFMRDPDAIFECCGMAMKLVTVSTEYTEVQA